MDHGRHRRGASSDGQKQVPRPSFRSRPAEGSQSPDLGIREKFPDCSLSLQQHEVGLLVNIDAWRAVYSWVSECPFHIHFGFRVWGSFLNGTPTGIPSGNRIAAMQHSKACKSAGVVLVQVVEELVGSGGSQSGPVPEMLQVSNLGDDEKKRLEAYSLFRILAFLLETLCMSHDQSPDCTQSSESGELT